jgi:hypothetical protein
MNTKQEKYNEKMRKRAFARKEKSRRDRENTPPTLKPTKFKPMRLYSGHHTQREYWRKLGAREHKA